jgi:four helix bundle protein
VPAKRSSYAHLLAWKATYRLLLDLYRVTQTWPRHELYGLTSQVRRAGYSASANIAEGAARKGPREFRRFLDYSLGSLAELSVGFRLAKDTGILSIEDYKRLRQKLRDAGRLTSALARSMRRAAAQQAYHPPR